MNHKRLFQRILSLGVVLILVSACGTPALAPTPTPVSPTATSIPLTPTRETMPTSVPPPPTREATPTPAMPGIILKVGVPIQIETISSIVGTGEISFTKRRGLTADIKGEISIIDGKSCDFCLSTIRIAPNLKVPLPLFSLSEVPPIRGTGRIEYDRFSMINAEEEIFTNIVGVIIPLPLKFVQLSGSIYRSPANITQIELVLELEGPATRNPDSYILAGPSGAILKKDANSFVLVEGQASIVQK